MPNLYNLTAQIHQNLQKVCEKYGLEKLEIESDYILLPDDCGPRIFIGGASLRNEIPAIQSPQIRQILLAFKEVLGENPNFKLLENAIKENQLLCNNKYTGLITVSDIFLLDGGLPIPKSQAEALCQKWLDSLTPMFDREPETVLTELLELLEILNII
jgi:hypothetical protein